MSLRGRGGGRKRRKREGEGFCTAYYMSGLYSLLTLDPLHMLFAVQKDVAGIGVVQQCSRNPSKHIHEVAPGRPQCDMLHD